MSLAQQLRCSNKEKAKELMFSAIKSGMSVEVEDIFFKHCKGIKGDKDELDSHDVFSKKNARLLSNANVYSIDWKKIQDELERLLNPIPVNHSGSSVFEKFYSTH